MENFGDSKSTHAIVHQAAGKFFLAVFILMCVFGGIRPLFRTARLISMAVHSITGFVLYFTASKLNKAHLIGYLMTQRILQLRLLFSSRLDHKFHLHSGVSHGQP